MSVVCIAEYMDWQEAMIAKSKLEFYGIPAFFVEEHYTRCKQFFIQGATGCHIEVPTFFEEDARFLLTMDPEDEIVLDEPLELGRTIPQSTMLWLLVTTQLYHFAIPFILDNLFHWLIKKQKKRSDFKKNSLDKRS